MRRGDAVLPPDSLGDGLWRHVYGFSLDNIFMNGEEKAEKVCPVMGGRACGG